MPAGKPNIAKKIHCIRPRQSLPSYFFLYNHGSKKKLKVLQNVPISLLYDKITLRAQTLIFIRVFFCCFFCH